MNNGELTWGETFKLALLIILLTVCIVGGVVAVPFIGIALNQAVDIRSAAIPCEGLLTR